MPPAGRPRRKEKGEASDCATEMTNDVIVPPLRSETPYGRAGAEILSSGSEAGVVAFRKHKRRRSGRIVAGVNDAAVDSTAANDDAGVKRPLSTVVSADSAGSSSTAGDGRCHRRTSGEDEKSRLTVAAMVSITDEFYDAVRESGVSIKSIMEIVGFSRRYERMLLDLLVENERLRGRLDIIQSPGLAQVSVPAHAPAVQSAAACGVTIPVAPTVTPTVAVSSVAVQPKPVPEPVETWSVVVRGKSGATSKEVIDKVVEQVGPTLGVRVHEIRPIRDGGAVIRTRSVAERERLVKNRKFKEVGLEVAVNEKLGPKVMVRGVYTVISPADFMSDLFELNFKEKMSPEEFEKSVRLVTAPWNADSGAQVNVVLQGSECVVKNILEAGRVYIGWYSFRVRMQDAIAYCYRCLSYDHRVKDCRYKQDVCRLCGGVGHLASDCDNAIHCRECALRREPADHVMLSYSCPIYAALVAKANARH